MIGPRWRKSSHSQTNGACVEVCHTLDAVRDSKNPAGPALRVDVAAFLRAVNEGRFDR
jgi:hypothetical protein